MNNLSYLWSCIPLSTTAQCLDLFLIFSRSAYRVRLFFPMSPYLFSSKTPSKHFLPQYSSIENIGSNGIKYDLTVVENMRVLYLEQRELRWSGGPSSVLLKEAEGSLKLNRNTFGALPDNIMSPTVEGDGSS